MSTKKITAYLLAVSTIVGSVCNTTASAMGLPQAPLSAFEYDFTAVPVATSTSLIDQVKVTFQVTNNPGLSHIGIAFMYDMDTTPIANAEFSSEIIDENYVIFRHPDEYHEDMFIIEFEKPIGSTAEIDDCFSVSLIFDISEDASIWNEFSVAVVGYTSEAEGIYYNNMTTGQSLSPETSVQLCPYIAGDIDDNGVIEIADASALSTICSLYGDNSSSKAISVEDLNQLISEGAFINNAVLSNMRCAEVANVLDEVGCVDIVNVADGEEILRYYSSTSANLSIDSIVGDAMIKTVVI